MDITSKIQKFCIHIIKSRYLAVLVALSLIATGFNLNLEHLQSTFLNIYFFLTSTTDRIEDIHQHMESVHLSPIDISEKTFEVEENV